MPEGRIPGIDRLADHRQRDCTPEQKQRRKRGCLPRLGSQKVVLSLLHSYGCAKKAEGGEELVPLSPLSATFVGCLCRYLRVFSPIRPKDSTKEADKVAKASVWDKRIYRRRSSCCSRLFLLGGLSCF